MRKLMMFVLATMVSLSAAAASKDSGKATLKDVQPTGTTDKKHKHQAYDLSFNSSTGKKYTCRTGEKENIRATNFVVGGDITYEVKGNKGKVNSPGGNQAECTVVRVEQAPDAAR